MFFSKDALQKLLPTIFLKGKVYLRTTAGNIIDLEASCCHPALRQLFGPAEE